MLGYAVYTRRDLPVALRHLRIVPGNGVGKVASPLPNRFKRDKRFCHVGMNATGDGLFQVLIARGDVAAKKRYCTACRDSDRHVPRGMSASSEAFDAPERRFGIPLDQANPAFFLQLLDGF